MKISSNKEDRREDFSSVCADVRPDDGIPPAILSKREKQNRDQRRRVGKIRSQQLCGQIRQALADALLCDCSDPLLADANVEKVESVCGSSVVLASISLDTLDPELLDELHARLRAASGLLRASIAGAIHRKRVPQLRFAVTMAEAQAE